MPTKPTVAGLLRLVETYGKHYAHGPIERRERLKEINAYTEKLLQGGDDGLRQINLTLKKGLQEISDPLRQLVDSTGAADRKAAVELAAVVRARSAAVAVAIANATPP